MSFASNMVAVAVANIRKFGADITITRADASTVDAKGVLDSAAGLRTPPEQIESGNRLLYIAAGDLAFTPAPGEDVVTVAGEDWQITSIDTTFAAGTPVLHKLEIRQ